MPTAAQVAERAGYSVRSVFERFPDLHALRIAATDYAFAQANDPSATPASKATGEAGSSDTWKCAPASAREWLPLWRALNANKGESKELKLRVEVIRARDTEQDRAHVPA